MAHKMIIFKLKPDSEWGNVEQIDKIVAWLEEHTGEKFGIINYGYWNYHGSEWKLISAYSKFNRDKNARNIVMIEDPKIASLFALSWEVTNG